MLDDAEEYKAGLIENIVARSNGLLEEIGRGTFTVGVATDKYFSKSVCGIVSTAIVPALLLLSSNTETLSLKEV